MVAVENSIDGMVGESIRRIRKRENVFVTMEVYCPINLCLGGMENSKEEKLEEVYSHPKALGQCSEYLEKLGANKIPTKSTTAAIRIVKELGNPKVGVIAPKEAIEKNGLKVLKEGVQDEKNNYTIFWELSNKKEKGHCTALIVDLIDKPGALYEFLKPFARKGINLYAIHSWPENGKYWFLVKVRCSNEEIPWKELERRAEKIRDLGSYSIKSFL